MKYFKWWINRYQVRGTRYEVEAEAEVEVEAAGADVADDDAK